MTKQPKRTLRWLEAGLYLGGAAMLAVFVWMKTDSNRQAQQGIDEFLASAPVQQQVQPVEAASESPAAGDPWVNSPDQSTWAQQRIDQYQESLAQSTEPPLGILSMGRLGIQVPVYNGTDEFNLNRGAGRILGTARIDEPGNLGIAAHRDGFFRPLKDVEIGDEMKLLTHSGEAIYRVSSIEITDPSDVSVLAPTDEKTITLVTCYPFYYVGHAPQRFIVKATVEHFLAKN